MRPLNQPIPLLIPYSDEHVTCLSSVQDVLKIEVFLLVCRHNKQFLIVTVFFLICASFIIIMEYIYLS